MPATPPECPPPVSKTRFDLVLMRLFVLSVLKSDQWSYPECFHISLMKISLRRQHRQRTRQKHKNQPHISRWKHCRPFRQPPVGLPGQLVPADLQVLYHLFDPGVRPGLHHLWDQLHQPVPVGLRDPLHQVRQVPPCPHKR